MGDPVIFSTYLITQIANNPGFTSSFNLGADKGYGYLWWDWDRDAMPTDPKAIPLDGMNHGFRPPKTWPEGADKENGQERWERPDPVPLGSNAIYKTPLKLHYRGAAGLEAHWDLVLLHFRYR